MKNSLYISVFLAALILISPTATFASSKTNTHLADATGTVDPSTLLVESNSRASLSGTASSTIKVRYELRSESSKTIKSKTIKVKSSGNWSGKTTKKLKDGTYDVTLYALEGSKKKEIATSTLTVGIPDAVLTVSPIALLGGGSARAGSVVPISYLQIRNTSDVPVAIKGFSIVQTGSTPTSSIIGLSSVDDKGLSRTQLGGTEGMTVFTASTGYIPSTAVLAPGERKLFTLKAQLSQAAPIGSTLIINVTGVDAAAQFEGTFPITGTTWVVAQ